MSKRDDIAKEIVANCMRENGFSGQFELSAYAIADWYIARKQRIVHVTRTSAQEFLDKYGKYWVGTGIKLVDEIKEELSE